ncbi:hypothetical protein QBC43DRAFT_217017 [Cladorrhinum sp. PSN259]|nr:hypothetical protein QBC43DRAFT_217017 [Cladorrhinum sp. PSN259]
MCDYTQREYRCGHYRWIASKWCPTYQITHVRCEPNVNHFEYRREELCGDCKPKAKSPWDHLIKRHQTGQSSRAY